MQTKEDTTPSNRTN